MLVPGQQQHPLQLTSVHRAPVPDRHRPRCGRHCRCQSCHCPQRLSRCWRRHPCCLRCHCCRCCHRVSSACPDPPGMSSRSSHWACPWRLYGRRDSHRCQWQRRRPLCRDRCMGSWQLGGRMARREQLTVHVRDRKTEANRSGCHRHRRQSNSHAPNYRSPTVPWARRGCNRRGRRGWVCVGADCGSERTG